MRSFIFDLPLAMSYQFYLVVLFFVFEFSSAIRSPSTMKEQLMKHQIIPDVVTFPPLKDVLVEYSKKAMANFGNKIPIPQVQDKPWLQWSADPDHFYCLLMTDPDMPSREQPTDREYKHWLVVNIPGFDVSSGHTFVEYAPPAPPKDSGSHRYIFMIFKQQGQMTFEESYIAANETKGREKFSTRMFNDKYKLGNPWAMNFFHAEWFDAEKDALENHPEILINSANFSFEAFDRYTSKIGEKAEFLHQLAVMSQIYCSFENGPSCGMTRSIYPQSEYAYSFRYNLITQFDGLQLPSCTYLFILNTLEREVGVNKLNNNSQLLRDCFGGIIGKTNRKKMKAAFLEHHLIPDFLPVLPKKPMDIEYKGGKIANYGNTLTPLQTKDRPYCQWSADPDNYYALVMTDLDAPDRKTHVQREWLHWMVVNIPSFVVEDGDTLTQYVGPHPKASSGFHRYVFTVFEQGNDTIKFNEPLRLRSEVEDRPNFSTFDFAEKYGLGPNPWALNFIRVQYHGNWIDPYNDQIDLVTEDNNPFEPDNPDCINGMGDLSSNQQIARAQQKNNSTTKSKPTKSP